jgi:lipid-A-disaccharide synthase
MRRVIDKLYVIFPFEVSFFERYGMAAEYVGNPILEAIDQSLQRFDEQRGWDVDLTDELGGPAGVDAMESDKKVVLLMPGSRKNEVRGLLPNFVAAARKYNTNAFCVVAGAPGLDADFYRQILLAAVEKGQLSQADADAVKVFFGATYHLLMQLGDGVLTGSVKSEWKGRGVALVASGTATLETALLGVPQVVAYRVSGFTFFMAKWLVKLRWVSLVNILLDRGLLQEHLQDVSPERLSGALTQLNLNKSNLEAGYQELRDLLVLPSGSSASDGVVRGITKVLYL